VPKRNLTAASVMRLKAPPGGQVDYFDKGYPGLAVRVGGGGRRTFVYFYRLNGKLQRMSLGTFPALELKGAREAWRIARADVDAGRDPSNPRPVRGFTDFAGVLQDWLHRDQEKNKSHDAIKRLIDKDVTPLWGNRQISSITRRDVRDIMEAVADRGSPITARRLHSHLHRLFRWAVDQEKGGIQSNPAAGIIKPGEETKRDRVLTDKELAAVWKAAEHVGWPFGSAIKLLILTGARRAEIGELRWSEIHTNTIALAGDRTKNGEAHDIALSKVAISVVKSLPNVAGSEYIFTTNAKTPVSGWSKAKSEIDKLAKIAPWRIHDLRRTVATGLQKLGTNLQVIEAVLGHVSGSRAGVVGVYQRHSFDAEKRTALETWGKHVTALMK
jgi:integrase